MKKLILGVFTLSVLLSGCVVVKDRKPEATTTTRQTTSTVPATTTVERTTVY